MSGKIITRVRERQHRRGLVAFRLEYEAMREALHAQALERQKPPPIIRLVESETPGAYASDPISRFFRWVFRL